MKKYTQFPILTNIAPKRFYEIFVAAITRFAINYLRGMKDQIAYEEAIVTICYQNSISITSPELRRLINVFNKDNEILVQCYQNDTTVDVVVRWDSNDLYPHCFYHKK